MRVTLTLDDDVAEHLRRLAMESGRPFKQIVNDVLRAGLNTRSGSPPDEFDFPTYPLGQRPEVALAHARHIAVRMEDEEIHRKLELPE